MGLPGQETNVTISLAVWIHYMNVTDRQTDRQTDRERDRQTDRHTDRQTQTDRETDRQMDRQTDRQTDTGRQQRPHLSTKLGLHQIPV